jgi:hypothetical protein
MKRSTLTLSLLCALGTITQVHAQNLLVNGDFNSTPADVYYDGSDPTLADDVPGWVFALGAQDGSYMTVSAEADLASGGWDADMGVGPGGGSLSTAPLLRPAVIPGASYTASLTYDNYFGPNTTAYFIDWFNAGGTLLSSNGGVLADPNGALTYTPYTQLLSLTATAPVGAATAGVRFTTGNGSYNGLAADNFSFGTVPEPGTATLIVLAALGFFGANRRSR